MHIIGNQSVCSSQQVSGGGVGQCSICALINPRRACARVTVVVLCVCLSVCLCVCVSVPALAASAFVYIRKQRYTRVLFFDFDSWIFEKTFRSKVMA